jgi:A/G-specific adenine glycosylase
MRLQTSDIVSFHRVLTDYYYEFGRHDMLWRQPDREGVFDPYKILISEVMLQQTQVDRVTPKYAAFVSTFPVVQSLAQAPLSDVLKLWNGLGYNRRAKYVWQAAQTVEARFGGAFPEGHHELRQLPGVGPNTAGAIAAYAYNQPAVFVETNVRTVIIHHFFKDRTDIPDTAIHGMMQALVPQKSGSKLHGLQGAILGPREFYWAVMDYGTYLKKTVGNLSRSSRHYNKQSAFQGSQRQVRGQVVRLLADKPHSRTELIKHVADERLQDVLTALAAEGLITERGHKLHLSD